MRHRYRICNSGRKQVKQIVGEVI
jgi:hypothetical protein